MAPRRRLGFGDLLERVARPEGIRTPDPLIRSPLPVEGQQPSRFVRGTAIVSDAVFVDSGVSLDPAPERVLVPSRELERVRCPRLDRLSSNAHDESSDYTPRRC